MGRHRLSRSPHPVRRARHALPCRSTGVVGPVAVAASALLLATPAAALADEDGPTTTTTAADWDDDADEGSRSTEQDGSEDRSDDSADDDADDSPVSGSDLVGGSGLLDAVTGADLPGAEDVTDIPGADELGDAAVSAVGIDPGTTTVTLAARNGSGIDGEATIDPDQVVATASGMDPNERYVSFFYGATSSATNNNPCILDGTNPLPSDQTIGEWEVDEDGNGTLRADNPLGKRYGLQAGTISIRQVQHDFDTATALPVNPASYSLVSCGAVQRIDVVDPVTDVVPGLPKLTDTIPAVS